MIFFTLWRGSSTFEGRRGTKTQRIQAHIQDFAQGWATAKRSSEVTGPRGQGLQGTYTNQKPKTLQIWSTMFSRGPFNFLFSYFYYFILFLRSGGWARSPCPPPLGYVPAMITMKFGLLVIGPGETPCQLMRLQIEEVFLGGTGVTLVSHRPNSKESAITKASCIRN